MKTEAVIVAAGSSRRAGCDKLTYEIGGKMILEYSLDAFQSSPFIDRIILVGSSRNLGYFRRHFTRRFSKLKTVAKGGRWRGESVLQGLKQLDKDTQAVLIHDGARPFISLSLIEKIFAALKRYKAVIPVLRLRDTLKLCQGGRVLKTLDERRRLFLAHTPQAFRREIIEEAYRGRIKWPLVYDDAFLVERKKLAAVKIIESSMFDFKITFAEDLVLAKAIVKGYVKGRARF